MSQTNEAAGEQSHGGDRSSHRSHGGVSPHKSAAAPAAAGLASAKGAHADFKYNGGAVVRLPRVYAGFWGPRWADAAHQARAQRLGLFLRDLLASGYMNVISQYGVGAGAGAAGAFVKSGFEPQVPSQLDEAGIARVIQGAIDSGALPEPPAAGNDVVLVIYLDETVAVSQPGLRMCEPTSDNAFGFHNDFVTKAGHEFYYAVVPALDDNCIKNTCGPAGGCTLHLTQTQEQRLTQVTSHEFAEMCTDPKFRTGWYGPISDENGDICNGEAATITVGANTWNVQRQYSKTDDENSHGKTFCVVTAAKPMAKRSDGPP